MLAVCASDCQISQVKVVLESELAPLCDPPPPARMIDGGLAFSVRRILEVCRRGYD